jgi:phosphoglycerate dehydrogenase-like enzyme
MRVLATKREPVALPYFEQVLPSAALPELLAQADYVAITAPLTPETKGMIGAAELRQMKPTAFLINVARGPLIDEEALLTALRERWIAGACLDVFEEEPLPADSPFWDLENVVITPHASWGSPYSMDYVLDEFIENLQRYLQGAPLLNLPKNLAFGY